MSHKIPFIWSNDDLSARSDGDLDRMLAFLDRFGIKGTFFVVPCVGESIIGDGGHFLELSEAPHLVADMKAARKQGHEFQQHGTTHVWVENGTADLRMVDLMGDEAKKEYSQDRFVNERLWQVDALQAQINWGREVWIEAMGEPPTGFRPGCGSFCGNMYPALENLGFQWCSARMVSMTGWKRRTGLWNYPLGVEGPVRPFLQGKIWEYPIMDDVAFVIPAEKIDDMVELGWQLWQECVQRDLPYILVSHPFALAHEGGTGYAIHEKLLTRILESGQAEPMTLGEYHGRVSAGELPVAAAETLYPNAETFPSWHIWGRGPVNAPNS